MQPRRNIEAIDLFCGIGGLSYGLKQAGIDVKAGLDLDSSCKYAYEQNVKAKFIEADIATYDIKQLKKHYAPNSTKILVGCAPCQPFSHYSRKNQNKQIDKRWNLISYFVDAVKILNPEIVSMENVIGLIKTDVFDEFKKSLLGLGYTVSYSIVNCSDYGLPQRRKRLVFIASKFGILNLLDPADFTNKTYRTVRDAIGGLEPIGNGEYSSKDYLHKSSNLSDLNIKRLKASKPGGTWRDWPKSLIANCHKKARGAKFLSVYSRMEWDKQSPTITTQFLGFSRGRFGHPEQNRTLTLREGAILQGFPADYEFVKKGEEVKSTVIGRHIGNAVPVSLGNLIGKSSIEHTEGFYNA